MKISDGAIETLKALVRELVVDVIMSFDCQECGDPRPELCDACAYNYEEEDNVESQKEEHTKESPVA